MSLGSRDEDKEISVENIFKNGWNISKFSETHKFTASQNSAILKKEKLRKKNPPTLSIIIIKLLKIKDLKKYFKSSQRKMIYYI